MLIKSQAGESWMLRKAEFVKRMVSNFWAKLKKVPIWGLMSSKSESSKMNWAVSATAD